MARYRYKGIGSDGQVVAGELAARSKDAALAQLRSRGLAPLSVDLRARLGGKSGGSLFRFVRKRVTPADLIVFTREVNVLLSAAVPLDRALKLVESIGEAGPMGKISGSLLSKVANGTSLSDSMRDHADVFPEYYVGMVRAGEAGGALGKVFSRLFEMLEKRAILTSKIRSAMIYPMIVLTMTALSIVVLMVLVIPEFKPIFAQAGDALPTTTKIIVAASDFILNFGTYSAAGLLVALLMLSRLKISERARARLDRLLLWLPVVGPLERALETGRFCQMLGTLRMNGVPLVDAMRVAGETLRNRAIANGIRQAIQPLSQGRGLSKPLADTGMFPDLALQLIEVGEESGKLDEMLLQVSEIYEVEVDRKIQTFLALLVPLITVALGLVVAFVIGSILSAILGSYRIAL